MPAQRDVCKSDQEVAHGEKSSTKAFESCLFKKSIAEFHTACATERKSTEGESSCAVAKKRKSLTNLDLAEFIQERGIRSYTELLVLLRSGELLARWTLVSLYSNKMKKYSVNLLPKLGKWCQRKKNQKPAKHLESIE